MIALIAYFIIGVVVLLLLYRYSDFMENISTGDLIPIWISICLFWPFMVFMFAILPTAGKLHNWLLGIRKE